MGNPLRGSAAAAFNGYKLYLIYYSGMESVCITRTAKVSLIIHETFHTTNQSMEGASPANQRK